MDYMVNNQIIRDRDARPDPTAKALNFFKYT
jgi:hypothetical protein